MRKKKVKARYLLSSLLLIIGAIMSNTIRIEKTEIIVVISVSFVYSSDVSFASINC